jgi:predicted nucleic-acid-binding protein
MKVMYIFTGILTTREFVAEKIILRQVYSLSHSEFWTRCDLVLSLSNPSAIFPH